MSRRKKTIIILSFFSGGSGHLQAARAYKDQLQKQFPDHQILIKDPTENWLWPFGKYLPKSWTLAQRKGNLYHQIFCVFLCTYPIADLFFLLPFFFGALYTLIRYRPVMIYDTQVLATKPMLVALQMHQFFTKKSIPFFKVLTDFPTPVCFHFLSPLKRLSSKQKKMIKIMTMQPLTNIGETTQDFWKQRWKIPPSQIMYTHPPLREKFFLPRNDPSQLLSLDTPFDQDLLVQTLHKQNISFKKLSDSVDIQILPSSQIITITLGTYANLRALKTYMNLFIKFPPQKPTYLILLYGNRKNTASIYDHLQTLHLLPHLFFIPAPFQSDHKLAALYISSQHIISRASGITSMELFITTTAQIWIHHEPSALTRHRFLKYIFPNGMPIWEKGNALYLKKFKNAKMISPSLFEKSIFS